MKKDEISVIPTDSKKTLEQFFRYFSLSSLLFDRGKREIYNVTDIPRASKFRKIAKQTAERLGVRWQGMSHEDSNRVMLAMLEDAFNLIREVEDCEDVIICTMHDFLKKTA